ncbi:peptidoglycan-binding domain-containing protein [Streptomyces sp. NRRL WC-3742]|uniref:peptidoglycan-binding domain-containing protein n=1 Tax=Streptomyces sp. NRRL WC-3742 TaxID=1463934 RepID=UPI00068C1F18|nr:peptidoglycan-binding domain-containing protein [Streptomyces sp. NRRL WC-3742]
MKKITAALGVAALALSLGVAAAPAASAQSSSLCNYTNSEPVLHRGSSGIAVKQLQCELHYAMSGSNLTRDGSFGPATEADVVRFQQCAGLTVDASVGPNTWAALDYWTTAPDYVC